MVVAGLVQGLVDLELPALEYLAVYAGDGGLGLLDRAHLHKAKALGSARVAVSDDFHGINAAVILEKRAERTLNGIVAEVPDVEFITHKTSFTRFPFIKSGHVRFAYRR